MSKAKRRAVLRPRLAALQRTDAKSLADIGVTLERRHIESGLRRLCGIGSTL
jgi:hypothetical protein